MDPNLINEINAHIAARSARMNAPPHITKLMTKTGADTPAAAIERAIELVDACEEISKRVGDAPTLEEVFELIDAGKAARPGQGAGGHPTASAARAALEEIEGQDLLSLLKKQGKISAQQEATVWPSLSLEAKRSFAATAPVIQLMVDKGVQESGAACGAFTSSSKAFADMTWSEKAKLKRMDPARFEELRAVPPPAKSYAALSFAERAELKRRDPTLFEELRDQFQKENP